jgi:alkylation response protein AidB-like acyl-CoA dehydrogenase
MATKETAPYELIKESLSKFLTKEVLPYIDQWEKEKHCPREIFQKMGEQGFFGVSFPEQYGGSGMDFWGAVAVSEVMAKFNMGGLGMSLYAHNFLPLPLILAIGTEEQKQKYLVPALKGEKIAALAITEPGAGSDVAGIKTTATEKDDHFVINGSKMFITNGNLADFIVLVTRTGEGYDLTTFIFETNTPGFKAIEVKNKLGMHTSDTAQLFFDNCIVPKSQILGQKSMGFYYIMNNLQEERLLAAVTATFAAEWALEKAILYSKEREAFGRPIGKFQVIRHKIAEMATKLEACKAITFRAVQDFIDNGPAAVKTITMAKAFTCHEAQLIIDEALQIHGGWGYMEDYGIARAFRDCRLLTIGAGTSEIMNEIISKIVIEEVKHKTVIDHR